MKPQLYQGFVSSCFHFVVNCKPWKICYCYLEAVSRNVNMTDGFIQLQVKRDIHVPDYFKTPHITRHSLF